MEMHKTECEKLATRLEKMEQDGVVDVKFFLKNQEEASLEDACREAHDMLEAVECGEYEPAAFNDSYRR